MINPGSAGKKSPAVLMIFGKGSLSHKGLRINPDSAGKKVACSLNDICKKGHLDNKDKG